MVRFRRLPNVTGMKRQYWPPMLLVVFAVGTVLAQTNQPVVRPDQFSLEPVATNSVPVPVVSTNHPAISPAIDLSGLATVVESVDAPTKENIRAAAAEIEAGHYQKGRQLLQTVSVTA